MPGSHDVLMRAARDLDAITEDELAQLRPDDLLFLDAHYNTLLAEMRNVIRRRHQLAPVRAPGVSEGRLSELCDALATGRLSIMQIPVDEWALLVANDAQSAAIDRSIVANVDRGVA